MRLVSNVLMLFLASLLFVACGDDDKKENGNGNNGGDGGDDGLTLKFDGLANFKPTEKPEDFKVTVNKGTAVDDTSTLEITVKIVCGDNEASKTVAAEKGVAEFKINDFSKAKFTDVAKDASCKATATAEGATEGSKEFKAAETGNGAGAAGIDGTGLITGSGTVKLVNKGTETCGAHLVKWTTSGTNHTAVSNAAGGDGLDLPNVYLSGAADVNTKCEVTVAGTKVTIAAAMYPATAAKLAVEKAATSDPGKLNFEYANSMTFTWALEAASGSPTFTPSSGSVSGEKEEIPVAGITANHANANIWIKHSGGVQKI